MKDQEEDSYASFFLHFLNGHLQFLQPCNHNLGYLKQFKNKTKWRQTREKKKKRHLVAAR